MLHYFVAIFLDHLTGHDAKGSSIRQTEQKARTGCCQIELHGVAIKGFNTLDGLRIVELAPLFVGGGFEFREPQNLITLQQVDVLALVLGVVVTLVGEDHIVGGQLTLFATKGLVIRKQHAFAQADRPGLVIVADLWHGGGKQGTDFERPRQVVVLK